MNSSTAETSRLIRIFWTGGFDSTYRILELSKQSVTVEPIYVTTPTRSGAQHEIRAMQAILEKLKSRETTKAEFLPLRIIAREDIPENQEITAAYDRIRKEKTVGTQYEWLGRLAAQMPGIELGVEGESVINSGTRATMLSCGSLLEDNGVYYLDPANTTADGMLLFGNYRFPIIDKPWKEMYQDFLDMGEKEVLDLVWFCHEPLKDAPCGICRACQQKMEKEMHFLIPENAQRRYYAFCRIRKIFGDAAAIRIGRYVLRRLYESAQN